METQGTRIHQLRLKLTESLFFFAQKKHGLGFHFALSFILMLVALLARLMIAPVNAGIQYVTFFPAVTLAAVIGGFRVGFFSTLIGIVLATYIFTPPYYSFSIEVFRTSFWSNMVFFVDGIIVSLSIEAMHQFRHKYERQLVDAMAINKELEEFTYIASHDLKEPLRGIHNYASYLKEDCAGKLNNEDVQNISSIQRLAERMTLLTDKLLEYSKLGGTTIKMEAVDVDAVVDEVIKDMNIIRSSGIELRRIGKLGTATGNATLIGEVFQNLITNAAKFNDKPNKWVEIGRDDTGTCPVFYVRDNGIGIKQQHMDSVFRIFKRLHEQNKYGGGTGAGLTIVKKIIERHGGRIWLESVLGTGTTFYFTLCGDK